MSNTIFVILDSFLLPVYLIIVGFFVFRKCKGRLFDYILAIIVSLGLSELIKYFIARPRPDQFLGIEGASFPSTHTVVAFTALFFYVLVCHSFKSGVGKVKSAKFGVGESLLVCFTILGAILVAYSRLSLNAHYITDIIAGIILALIITLPLVYYDVSARRTK